VTTTTSGNCRALVRHHGAGDLLGCVPYAFHLFKKMPRVLLTSIPFAPCASSRPPIPHRAAASRDAIIHTTHEMSTYATGDPSDSLEPTDIPRSQALPVPPVPPPPSPIKLTTQQLYVLETRIAALHRRCVNRLAQARGEPVLAIPLKRIRSLPELRPRRAASSQQSSRSRSASPRKPAVSRAASSEASGTSEAGASETGCPVLPH